MKLLFLLLVLICVSCAERRTAEDEKAFAPIDQVDHYRLKYSDEQLHVIFTTENISMEERKLAEILYHKEPTAVNDSLFISDMDAAPYFRKTILARPQAEKIRAAFGLKKALLSVAMEPVAPLCAPTYRDILVLRKHKKIVGYAKMCFECSASHLVGAQSAAANLNADYDALSQILHGKPSSQ